MTSNRAVVTALYNPHILAHDEIVATFVARQPLLAELVDDLKRGGRQHHLLVGARGSGKTTMLLRLACAIEDDPKLAKSCIPLRFPEEQYNVSRLSDFWRNCIDSLIEALEKRGRAGDAKALGDKADALEALDEAGRAEQALGLLTGWARRARCHLVLLVDNLDLVLARVEKSHWALRETLSADNRIVVVGASPSFVREAAEYESPFYDFFNVHELGALSEDEAHKLVVQLARLSGNATIEETIAADPGRFKALYLLTGGMPRTLSVLQGVLATGPGARIEDDLGRLLDQVTPYYKARFDDLPSQSQVVLDAVALNWHPITAAECATKTRLPINVVSAQLDRLSKLGVTSKVALPGDRKLGFQVSERFFNIWYLMRASRRPRHRLTWLVEFLRIFYGEEEIRRRAEDLLASPEGRRAHARGAAGLFAFASAVSDPSLRRRLEAQAIVDLLDEIRRPGALREILDLEREDAHLVPVLDRARALREMKQRIRNAKVTWPRGTTAEQVAHGVAAAWNFSLRTKIALSMKLDQRKARLLVEISKPDGLGKSTISLVEAIAHGQIPSFPDIERPEDLDDILALSGNFGKAVLFAAVFMLDALRDNGPPEALARHALWRGSTAADGLLAISELGLESDGWSVASRRVGLVLEHWASGGLPAELSAFRHFCARCAQLGFAKELASLLERHALVDRLLPFYEALRAAAVGVSRPLEHLAPEVRAPAEEILATFQAPSDVTATSAARRPRRRPRKRGP